MLGTKQDSTLIYDHPSKIFVGVRFVLLGFDPINAQKVRSKLVNGGGVDVFQYGPNCTHVIVDNVTYDDPICVAARTEGKVLVTGLWVDHSLDVCMPVDPTFVIYRPLRDLGGIPGSKSLIVCLTGYQRQDRDDIMTLVGLMGATFSKPLVANKVTHLICYKFEGEKYELAKKMKRIKLVNHRWLEDCLRAWEILPEANYDKSGYELEMMEAEAKDSEEEEEAAQEIDKNQYEEKKEKVSVSPQNLHIGAVRAHPSPQSKEDVSRNLLGRSASKGLSSAGNYNDAVLATAEEIIPVQTTNLQDIHKKHPVVLGSLDSRTLVVPCRTPTSIKSGNDFASNSGSAKRSPQSDAAKLSTKSYSRKTPRRNTLSMASNLSSFPKVDMDKFNLSARFDLSSPRAEKSRDGTDSGCVKTPLKETDSCHEGNESVMLPEKRKISVTYGSSKSQKLSHHPKACISESPLMVNRTGGSEPAILINNGLDENATLGTEQTSPDNIAMANFSSFNRKSLQKPAVDVVITENKQENNPEAPQTSSIGLKNMILDSGPVDKDVRNRAENAVNEVAKPHKEQQDDQVPSPGTKGLEKEKSESPMDLSKGKNVDSQSKPVRRKVIAKRSLSSRAKLGLGSTKNKKGSIYLNETALQSEAMISLTTGAAETADKEMFVNSGKLEMIPPTVKVDNALLMETNNVEKSGSLVDNRTGSMDDETEAPEDKEEREFEAGDGKEKTEEVDPMDKVNLVMENQLEGVQPITIKADASSFRACSPSKTSHEDENGAEHEEAVCGRKNEPNKSTTNKDGGREKLSKCKKRPLSKTLRKSVHSTLERRKSKEGVYEDESKSRKNNEAARTEKENSIPSPSLTGKSKRTVSSNKLENSLELEKENRPVIGDQNDSHGKQRGGKVASKSSRTPMKTDSKAVSVTDRDSVPAEKVIKVKAEPAWFILSGHKLQRKEFQQVIRRLRGRVCRDSHQWSYQATHFIVPDPIRRTEKLFAAVASGRWILKTDYLTASNQAGRFLAEEPFEWHKSGLSEDGAINLEAPRKWRLLRERTSHGAFYGMRVVIYGECIAPPLDTLKRVIRAGDGTILATSPPYTRFLKSGVDYAIVSPGMPRVDMWVQEFLRHEIPCVVADYLVEYVCKPGYSLERHVQYNTHAWAERSFANLMGRLEEVVEPKTPEDCEIIDLPCQVCGSPDRGEVMLICGNENGSVGCGVGTHIDCCNPPLEEVPNEDWFCPKCSESINSLNRGKSTKKRISSKGK